jgi:hypothetical protein
MHTKDVDAQINKSAEKIESGVAAAAAGLSNGVDALGERHDEILGKLRDIGNSLLDSTKTLTDEAAKQAHLRPLAVFGVAFVAGVIVARALRR